MRKRPEIEPMIAPDDARAIETAWNIHAAQADWTGKVDAKAGFAFAVNSAAIATAVALTAKDHVFADLGYSTGFYWLGLGLLLISAALTALVVAPNLRGKNLAKQSANNFIYFGHAKHWRPEDLEAALRNLDILPQLSRQIVIMAEVAWTKHRRVQWSIWLTVAGGGTLAVVGALLEVGR